METMSRKIGIIKWFRRIGVWGFLFFLIKGMLWLLLGFQFFK
ncbi:MAG: alanyl-tRNA synthetase [Bacteroidetes bacterium]|nr:alanyl-tRNA synthetase [Bacteroidota bacterium]